MMINLMMTRWLLTNHPLERMGAKLFRDCESFGVIWARDLIPTTNQYKQTVLVNINVRRSKRHRETYRKSRKPGVSRFWFVSSITQAVWWPLPKTENIYGDCICIFRCPKVSFYLTSLHWPINSQISLPSLICKSGLWTISPFMRDIHKSL